MSDPRRRRLSRVSPPREDNTSKEIEDKELVKEELVEVKTEHKVVRAMCTSVQYQRCYHPLPFSAGGLCLGWAVGFGSEHGRTSLPWLSAGAS